MNNSNQTNSPAGCVDNLQRLNILDNSYNICNYIDHSLDIMSRQMQICRATIRLPSANVYSLLYSSARWIISSICANSNLYLGISQYASLERLTVVCIQKTTETADRLGLNLPNAVLT